MNEWKELKIDNLPDMTKEYDSEVLFGSQRGQRASLRDNLAALFLGEIDHPIYYRERQPKAQTHEELAEAYLNKVLPVSVCFDNSQTIINGHLRVLAKNAFIAGCDSVDIKSEENNG